MPLYLLHGDNYIKSREHFLELNRKAKSKGYTDVVSISGTKTDLTEVLEACEADSLFGSHRLVTIDRLHKNRSKKKLAEIISYLNQLDSKKDAVILWEDKTLTPSQLKKLSNFNPTVFKSSSVIFTFLDSVYPGNQTAFFPLFNAVCQIDGDSFALHMLIRLARQLIEVEDAQVRMAPWQKAKLRKQKNLWSEPQILDFHQALLEIDWRLKSGRSVQDLKGELEWTLAQL